MPCVGARHTVRAERDVLGPTSLPTRVRNPLPCRSTSRIAERRGAPTRPKGDQATIVSRLTKPAALSPSENGSLSSIWLHSFMARDRTDRRTAGQQDSRTAQDRPQDSRQDSRHRRRHHGKLGHRGGQGTRCKRGIPPITHDLYILCAPLRGSRKKRDDRSREALDRRADSHGPSLRSRRWRWRRWAEARRRARTRSAKLGGRCPRGSPWPRIARRARPSSQPAWQRDA